MVEQIEFRQIRTVAFDPVRAPLIRLAFELYVTGDYTLADLSDELYDRGLRTRATKKHPAKQVSINKLSCMLRDRYYLGYITYKGEAIPGRHEALIDEGLFEQRPRRQYGRPRRRERPIWARSSPAGPTDR